MFGGFTGNPDSRRPTRNRGLERTRWWGKRRRGSGPWLRHWWGEVPVGCAAVSSALGVCSGSYGSTAYVFVNAVEETAAGVCWSCGDALQSAAFPLAEAKLLGLAAPLAISCKEAHEVQSAWTWTLKSNCLDLDLKSRTLVGL
jgi:hypothetical protein